MSLLDKRRLYGQSLNLVLRFHGAVVQDTLIGADGRLREGGALTRVGPGRFELAGPRCPLALQAQAEPDGVLIHTLRGWTYQQTSGAVHTVPNTGSLSLSIHDVEIEMRTVLHFRLPRQLPADVLFVGVVAMAMAIGMQLQGLLVPPDIVASTPQSTPELIARLLAQDYEGVDGGSATQVWEQTPFEVQSFVLPAGDVGDFDSQRAGADAPTPRQAEHQAKRGQDQERQLALAAEEQPEQPPHERASEQALAAAADGDHVDGLDDAEQEEAKSQAEREGWGYKDQIPPDVVETMRIKTELALAQAALKIDPDDAWALGQVAYYQYLSEDFVAAEKSYRRYVELYPDSAAGYNNLALVYKRSGDYELEESYYQRALEIEPDDTSALNNLAVNLAHQARYQEALDIMDRVERIEPGHPYADLHRAKIYASMGEPEQALASLDQALAGMEALDTLHHIEFRQDIRVDPALDSLRDRAAFTEILVRYYGEDGRSLVGTSHG